MRDLRDPQILGEHMQRLRGYANEHNLSRSFHEVADAVRAAKIADYSHTELLSTITAKEYQQELQEKAARGDRYAKSMLERGEPGDEPVDI